MKRDSKRDLIKQYLSEIGRKGGSKSRRILTETEAKRIVMIREEKRRKEITSDGKLYYECECGIARKLPIRCHKCGNSGVPMVDGKRVL